MCLHRAWDANQPPLSIWALVYHTLFPVRSVQLCASLYRQRLVL